jgi:hypothetical protein
MAKKGPVLNIEQASGPERHLPYRGSQCVIGHTAMASPARIARPTRTSTPGSTAGPAIPATASIISRNATISLGRKFADATPETQQQQTPIVKR